MKVKLNYIIYIMEEEMSAIAGILHFNQEPVPKEQINNLMKQFQMYPADDVQTWHKETSFLGCHAQWITPESVGEQQPYYDYSRQLAITADAIIDNRNELFGKLQINQSQRKIIPDCQLILLAYGKWGEEVPKHLIGDFAFMIWDEKKHKLFGARDFSGARTLYYYSNDNQLAFSTTIKPLFTLPYIEKKLNEEWLAGFIAIPNMVEAVDMSSTVYKSINQVPPSHSISVVNGSVKLNRYCKINVDQNLKLKSNEEYIEAFQDVFQKAVISRIRTHGEVGSHLSGGLDSGAVVSFAAKALQKQNKRLHTFSYIPEDDFVDWTPKYYIPDETTFIKETVNFVGNINDRYLNFEGNNPLLEVDDFLNLMEMPYKFFENSFWLKGINKVAHQQGIKVLLNGSRGNHSISFGSRRLTIDYYASLLKKFKWLQLSRELNSYCKNFKTGKSVMLPIVTRKAFPLLTRKYKENESESFKYPEFISPLLAQKTKIFEKLQDYGVDLTGATVQNQFEFRKNHFEQLHSWNKSGTVTTKMSLRYALWDRDPTNDLRVIKFCLAIPEKQYVLGGMERSFVRRATKDLLPDKVRLNQQSRGIQGADVVQRMASDWNTFIGEIQQLIRDPRISEVLNVDVLKSALTEIGDHPHPEIFLKNEFKILTRSLIVYRFIKNMN